MNLKRSPEQEEWLARMRQELPLYDDAMKVMSKMMTCDPDNRMKPWQVHATQIGIIAEALEAARKAK